MNSVRNAVRELFRAGEIPATLPSVSIKESGLPMRIANVFLRAGFETLDQLALQPIGSLRGLPGMGKKGWRDFIVFVAKNHVKAHSCEESDHRERLPLSLPSLAIKECGFNVRAVNALASAGFTNLKQLEGASVESLEAIDAIGRLTVENIRDSVHAITQSHSDSSSESGGRGALEAPSGLSCSRVKPDTFVGLVESRLTRLSGWSPDAIRLRLGVGTKAKTLEEIGNRFDVSRERVRQVVARFVKEEQAADGCIGHFETRVLDVLSNRATPLEPDNLLQANVFFDPKPYDFVDYQQIVRYFSPNINSIKIGQSRYLIDQPVEVWDEVEVAIKNRVEEAAEHNWALSNLKERLFRLLELYDFSYLEIAVEIHWLDRLATVEIGAQTIIIGDKKIRPALLKAILLGSSEPMHYSEVAKEASRLAGELVQDRYAHSTLPRVGAFVLGRGIYGLRKHIPLRTSDINEVRRISEELVESDPTRQWHSGGILKDVLKKRSDLKGVLDHYLINVCLSDSEKVKYLGKNVWVSPSSSEEIKAARMYLHDLIILALKDIGRPASNSEIKAWIKTHRGVREGFQVMPTPEYVSVGIGTWGLISRDIRFNTTTANIADVILQILREKGGPLTQDDLREVAESNDFGEGVNSFVLLSIANMSNKLRVTIDQEVVEASG